MQWDVGCFGCCGDVGDGVELGVGVVWCGQDDKGDVVCEAVYHIGWVDSTGGGVHVDEVEDEVEVGGCFVERGVDGCWRHQAWHGHRRWCCACRCATGGGRVGVVGLVGWCVLMGGPPQVAGCFDGKEAGFGSAAGDVPNDVVVTVECVADEPEYVAFHHGDGGECGGVEAVDGLDGAGGLCG